MTLKETYEIPAQGLTKYPSASLRELFDVSASLILALFSGSLMGFCDRLFLSHYSLEALEGCVSANSLIALFQIPSISIASIAQVFVGRYKGLGDNFRIGTSVWQMIWWALASLIIILPLGLLIEPIYFKGTSVATVASAYFRPLLIFNFLFPLGVALASFYIGQGHTKIVFLITLISHLINIALTPLLIFGVEGFFSPMGIQGAAIANIIAQMIYCAVLLTLFLQKKHRETYGTANYSYDKTCFFEGIRIGIPSALSRMITLATWAGATQIMLRKGGDYLLVLSVGSSIHLLFTFLNEGIGQGIVPIASYLMGKKEWSQIWKLMRSALLLLGFFLVFLSIPCLLCPEITISFFFTETPSPHQLHLLKMTCYYLWLYFMTYGFGKIGMSFLVAARDTIFLLLFNLSTSWLVTYIFVYCVIHLFNSSPDKLWLTMSITSLIAGMAYLWRLRQEKWKVSTFEGRR
jgi:MATE family multidrug resistance protein